MPSRLAEVRAKTILPQFHKRGADHHSPARCYEPSGFRSRHHSWGLRHCECSVFRTNIHAEKWLIETQDVGRNVCHGSDAVESAKKEIALWFSKDEVLQYKLAQHDWIYEK